MGSWFLIRNHIKSKLEIGESRSVNLIDVANGRMTLKDVLQDYALDDIYNTDELGLFIALGPSKTLASKNDKVKGTKKNKKRITVLLTSNASGKVKLKVND